MVDLSGPINMDTFMHCMTNIRLGKDEYKELTPKKKEEVDAKKKEKKMQTQTVPEMQTELKELLEKLSSAADEREAAPRDSTIVTYPPCSFTREAVLQTLGLEEPATDTEIKKEFQKRAAAQLSYWLVEAQKGLKSSNGKRPASTISVTIAGSSSKADAQTRQRRARQYQYVELVNRGERLLSEEPPEIQAAIDLFEQAATLDPDKPSGHMNLAIAHQRAGRHLDASQSFLDAMARYPADSEKWVTACAMAYDQRCHVAKGHPWACQAMPPPPEWMSSRADVLRMATRLVQAEGGVKQAVAWVMKAEAEEALGHLQEAARSYMHAAKQCKLDGESANQDVFAQRARDVLGKLRVSK